MVVCLSRLQSTTLLIILTCSSCWILKALEHCTTVQYDCTQVSRKPQFGLSRAVKIIFYKLKKLTGVQNIVNLETNYDFFKFYPLFLFELICFKVSLNAYWTGKASNSKTEIKLDVKWLLRTVGAWDVALNTVVLFNGMTTNFPPFPLLRVC